MPHKVFLNPDFFASLVHDLISYIQADITNKTHLANNGQIIIQFELPCTCFSRCCYESIFYELLRAKLGIP